jgi:hypothetical protein
MLGRTEYDCAGGRCIEDVEGDKHCKDPALHGGADGLIEGHIPVAPPPQGNCALTNAINISMPIIFSDIYTIL